jgi:hypothetical protein
MSVDYAWEPRATSTTAGVARLRGGTATVAAPLVTDHTLVFCSVARRIGLSGVVEVTEVHPGRGFTIQSNSQWDQSEVVWRLEEAGDRKCASDFAAGIPQTWAQYTPPLLTAVPVVSFTPPGPTTVQAALGQFVLTDTTAGPITVTLPATPALIGGLAVKQVGTAAGNTTTIALDPACQDVINENQQSLTLTLENEGVLLWWSPTEASWFVVSADVPLYGLDLRYLNLAGGSLTGGLTAESVSASGLTGAQVATRYAGGTVSGPPASGTFAKGDWIVDQTGRFWLTTAAGAGSWVQVGAGQQGEVDLVGGTKVVANTSITAASRIFLTPQADNGGTPGWLRISARTPGQDFTILSSEALDVSTVAYHIHEPLPSA